MYYAGLACAQALVVLNASKNQLAELRSDMLAAWASLRDLDVSFNQLTVGVRCSRQQAQPVSVPAAACAAQSFCVSCSSICISMA